MILKHSYAKAFAALILLCAAGFYQLTTSSKVLAVLLVPDNADTVRTGAGLYVKYCASCHGANLEGQPNWQTRLPNDRLPAPPHDKTGHTWHHNDALLFKITKLGTKSLAGDDYETDMRGFSSELSDDEIIAVLSYIKSTWPAEIRQRHDQMNKRSAKK